MLAGVVIATAVYVAGRELSTRPRALLAAGLVVVSGSVLWTTAPLAADGPASALAVVAVTVALGLPPVAVDSSRGRASASSPVPRSR